MEKRIGTPLFFIICVHTLLPGGRSKRMKWRAVFAFPLSARSILSLVICCGVFIKKVARRGVSRRALGCSSAKRSTDFRSLRMRSLHHSMGEPRKVMRRRIARLMPARACRLSIVACRNCGNASIPGAGGIRGNRLGRSCSLSLNSFLRINCSADWRHATSTRGNQSTGSSCLSSFLPSSARVLRIQGICMSCDFRRRASVVSGIRVSGGEDYRRTGTNPPNHALERTALPLSVPRLR